MKKKSLSLLLSGLLTVCLTGVGFASWIIVQGDTEPVTGQVNVETINNEAVTTISYSWADNNKNSTPNESSTTQVFGDDQFSFGSSSKENTGWLRNTDTKGEILTLELNVSVSNAQYLTENSSISIAPNSVKMDENGTSNDGSSKTGYDWAIEKNFITPFTASIKEGSFDESFVVVISTGWGTKFKGENPYAYYNSKSYDEYHTDASSTLALLQKYLSGTTFTLTINASVSA